jgi:hypothetical protein
MRAIDLAGPVANEDDGAMRTLCTIGGHLAVGTAISPSAIEGPRALRTALSARGVSAFLGAEHIAAELAALVAKYEVSGAMSACALTARE